MSNEYYPLVCDHLSSRSLVRQHIDSFDYFITKDIQNIVAANSVVDSDVCPSFYFKYTRVYVEKPAVSLQDGSAHTRKLFPNECRLRDDSYLGSCYVDVEYTKNKQILEAKRVFIGKIPIMLRSCKCHLSEDHSDNAHIKLGRRDNKHPRSKASESDLANDTIQLTKNVGVNLKSPAKTIKNREGNSASNDSSLKEDKTKSIHRFNSNNSSSGSKTGTDSGTISSRTNAKFPQIESTAMRDARFYTRDECPLDPGGYFIINGVERVVLVQEQLSKNRIILENVAGTHVASVTSYTAELKSKTNVVLHPRTDELLVRANAFSEDLPFTIVCRALGMHSDAEISSSVGEDLGERLEPSLEAGARARVFDSGAALTYISQRLKRPGTDALAAAREVVCTVLLPNITVEGVDCRARALCLCAMARRVLLAAAGRCQPDDRDFAGSKRCELAGQLLGLLFEDAFKRFNSELKKAADRALLRRAAAQAFDALQAVRLQGTILAATFTRAIATGNWVVKRFRMDRSGVTQVLPRLSYVAALGALARVAAQFERSRKVSGPRALHPSQWGLVCPADTPEGESCGLVKSLSLLADVTVDGDEMVVLSVSKRLGMRPPHLPSSDSIPVIVNGGAAGGVARPSRFVAAFRTLRRAGHIHRHVSIASGAQCSAIQIATDGGRITRPLILIKKYRLVEDPPSDSNQLLNDGNTRTLTHPNEFHLKFDAKRTSSKNSLEKQTLSISGKVDGTEINHAPGAFPAGPAHKNDNYCIFKHSSAFYDTNQSNTTIPAEELTLDQFKHMYSNLHSKVPLYVETCKETSQQRYTVFVPAVTDRDLEFVQRRIKDFTHLISEGKIEYIDCNESGDALIAISPDQILPQTTHMEISPFAILGTVSSLIPFPDHNQSPRNTYQCAMGKQAMGYIATNIKKRFDTLLYVLTYASKPLVKSHVIDLIHFEELPAGQNAMIAVMSFSGYDIEDALILNREAIDRGFGRCEVYKNSTTVLKKYLDGSSDRIFRNDSVTFKNSYHDATDFFTGKRQVGYDPNQSEHAQSRSDKMFMNHNFTPIYANQTSTLSYESPKNDFDGDQISEIRANTNNTLDNLNGTGLPQKTIPYVQPPIDEGGSVLETNLSQNPLNQAQGTTRGDSVTSHLNNIRPSKMTFLQYRHAALERDGIAGPGTVLRESQIYVNMESPAPSKMHKFSGQAYKNKISPSMVDKVLLTRNGEDNMIVKSNLRQVRNPEIGDKFSSRHGQKGVVGLIVDQVDMPFTETGLCPDIIMNPHGFPSRMTVGKILELVCGKYTLCTGKQVYSTPFLPFSVDPSCMDEKQPETYFTVQDRSSNQASSVIGENFQENVKFEFYNSIDCLRERSSPKKLPKNESVFSIKAAHNKAIPTQFFDVENNGKVDIEYIKRVLITNGFSYTGKEIFHSGTTGEIISAYIYYGPIYYQKLKHMVSDKIHARSTGPRTSLTRQPTEGRARDGGLRLGEMERDCLIGYGASQLLVERLLTSSDLFVAHICRECGIICRHKCTMCMSEDIASVKLPYACKLLFQELIGMNILPRIHLKK